jgi:hypothetical protein
MSKIKRSLIKTFLRTGSVGTPAWKLIGDGVTSAKINMNPKTLEETYITEDNANISVESYAPNLPIEMTAIHDDPAFVYLDVLRKARSVMESTETDIVNVWLYNASAGGWYPAEKQSVSIQTDDFGGDAGSAAKLNYTINFMGDPELGIFKPAATAEFDGKPVLAVLATMVIGSGPVTLSPLFAIDKYHQIYTGSVANAIDVVSMTSTCTEPGATIIQKVASATVEQGANAALSVGVNNLTIEVTHDTEVVTYHIDITRAAA